MIHISLLISSLAYLLSGLVGNRLVLLLGLVHEIIKDIFEGVDVGMLGNILEVVEGFSESSDLLEFKGKIDHQKLKNNVFLELLFLFVKFCAS